MISIYHPHQKKIKILAKQPENVIFADIVEFWTSSMCVQVDIREDTMYFPQCITSNGMF